MSPVNDEQFRAEVRGWLTTAAGVGRVRLPGRQGRHRPRARVRRRAHGLGAAPRRGRLDRPRLARGRRRARPAVAQAGHLLRGVRAGERPGARRPHRRAAGRADAADVRDAGAEGALPAGDRGRHRAVVPGVLRTGGRIRPRGAADAGVTGDDEWHIDGQKIWTSLAHVADWCFLLARTEAGSDRHRGLSCLLVPVRQPGIEIRPIMQITGTAEFNEVFFDDARTAAGNVAGSPGDGWRVALGMLGVERGVSNLGQLIGFQREFEAGARRGPRQREHRRSRHRRADRRRLDRAAGHAVHDGGRPRRSGRVTRAVSRRTSPSCCGRRGTSASGNWPSTWPARTRRWPARTTA